jgi:AcrR family transcriptional regulator
MIATPIDESRPVPTPAGQRGPVDHERRVQILDAANEHFRDYGYAKTTVADLARAIGMSAAYIYKFFDSKQAIGEAVCARSLGLLADELRGIAQSPKPAATRLRLIYKIVARRGAELCFNDRRLHDLAVTACAEKWQAVRDHQAALAEIVRGLVSEGRRSGEFERKTLIAETCAAVMLTLDLFSLPTMLEHNIDDPEGKAESVANLVLRSFAP